MRILLVAASVAAIAGPAFAQTLGPEGLGALRHDYPSVNQQQFPSPAQEPNREALGNQTRDLALSSARERIATGLVRKGRCDDALKLAQRQNNHVLAGRVTASCAALGDRKLPI